MLRGSRIVVVVASLTGCGGFLGLTGDDAEDPVDRVEPGEDASTTDGASGESSFDRDDAPSGADGGESDAKTDASNTLNDAGKDTGNTFPPVGCNGAPACTRYVFVTSATFQGNLNEATANTKCRDAAEALNAQPILKGRQWRAWLSGPTAPQDAKDRIAKGSMPYRLVDGTDVAADIVTLLDAANVSLTHAIDLDEKGLVQSNVSVWTSTDSQGNRVGGGDCMGWSSIGNGNGTVGSTMAVDGQWTNAGVLPCSSAAHLYCFEY